MEQLTKKISFPYVPLTYGRGSPNARGAARAALPYPEGIKAFSFLSIFFACLLAFSTLSITGKFYINAAEAAEEEIKEENAPIETPEPIEATSGEFTKLAVLQILNKIVAKTSQMQIPVGESAKFGELEIKVHKCWRSSPDQRPESKILLQIYDNANSAQEKKLIFYGWMFASTPSIASLEHPIYDVMALKCK